MRPGLDGIIEEQHGIFARWQAIGCGVTPREFDRLSRGVGPWVKVRYGVYTTRERWSALSRDDRRRLRDRAALLVCDDDAVLSHTSAARALGLPLYAVDVDLSHVTRMGKTQSSRVQAGVKHHVAALRAAEVISTEGLRVTRAERTVADLAREHGYLPGLVAADAALCRGSSLEQLQATALSMREWEGAPAINAVVSAANGGAQTPIETLGRVVLLRMGIDDLVLQHVIAFAEGGRAECDIYSPGLNHVFECDGKVKYREQFDGYGNLITPEDVIWLEKGREDKIRGEGVGFSRLTWADVQPDSFSRTAARLRREIDRQAGRRSSWLSPSA
jgi:hypothetical protein